MEKLTGEGMAVLASVMGLTGGLAPVKQYEYAPAELRERKERNKSDRRKAKPRRERAGG